MQDKYEKEALRAKRINCIKRIVDLSGKSVAPVIAIASLIGAMQLFFFAKAHSVKYIDLITSGIALSFGGVYSVYVCTIMGLYLIMSLVNASQNDFLQNTLIKKSRVQFIKSHTAIAQLIFSLIISIWPLALLTDAVAYEYALLVATIITFIVLFIYHNKFTTDNRINSTWCMSRFSSLPFAALPLISILVISISIVSVSKFLTEEFPDTPDWMAVVIIIFILTFINFFSFTPEPSEKQSRIPFSALFIPVIFLMLFMLPNALSSYTPNNIIKAMGVGLNSQCYLKKEIKETGIPEELQRDYGNIVKLNITANVGDIYYLAAPNDKEMIARFRFVSKNLKQIACPQHYNNMDIHSI